MSEPVRQEILSPATFEESLRLYREYASRGWGAADPGHLIGYFYSPEGKWVGRCFIITDGESVITIRIPEEVEAREIMRLQAEGML